MTRARELRARIEDPNCDSRARRPLTRGYFRLLRCLNERGVNLYAAPTSV